MSKLFVEFQLVTLQRTLGRGNMKKAGTSPSGLHINCYANRGDTVRTQSSLEEEQGKVGRNYGGSRFHPRYGIFGGVLFRNLYHAMQS